MRKLIVAVTFAAMLVSMKPAGAASAKANLIRLTWDRTSYGFVIQATAKYQSTDWYHVAFFYDPTQTQLHGPDTIAAEQCEARRPPSDYEIVTTADTPACEYHDLSANATTRTTGEFDLFQPSVTITVCASVEAHLPVQDDCQSLTIS
jgi:hypothetical protein